MTPEMINAEPTRMKRIDSSIEIGIVYKNDSYIVLFF
jgi:hypothetical protein